MLFIPSENQRLPSRARCDVQRNVIDGCWKLGDGYWPCACRAEERESGMVIAAAIISNADSDKTSFDLRKRFMNVSPE